MWSSSKLKKENAALRAELSEMTLNWTKMCELNTELIQKKKELKNQFPFELDDTVYEVQLRSASGRFTKTKASREQSTVSDIVVDKKNYFRLVDGLNKKSVYKTLAEAVNYLDDVCEVE